MRISHLIFETESEDELPWKRLLTKLAALSSPCELPGRNEPVYFIELEHEQGFQFYKSNPYLNIERHELPSGAFWAVRFEIKSKKFFS